MGPVEIYFSYIFQSLDMLLNLKVRLNCGSLFFFIVLEYLDGTLGLALKRFLELTLD